jgi:hypothetical protein
VRRAVRYDGFFPVNLEHPDQLAEIVAGVTTLRKDAGNDIEDDAFDVVVALPPHVDPAPYFDAGATWWLVEFPGDSASADQVRGVIRDGPVAV